MTYVIKRIGPVLALLWTSLAAGQTLEPVTLQLKWKHQFQFAGYYVAQARGFYRQAGLDVRIVEADDQHEPVAEVLSGRAQFGVGGNDLVVERAKGQPVVVLAVIYQHSPLVLMARADRGITSVQDLVGKRVMMGPPSESAELSAMLAREGVSAGRIKPVPTSFGLHDMLAGKVDAQAVYVTDEPFEARQKGLGYVLLNARTTGVDLYGDNLFTAETEIRQHAQRVARFREASLRGWKEALARPEEAIDLIIARYGQRKTREQLAFEAQETRRLVMPDVVEPGYMYEGRWQHIAEVYQEVGLIREVPNLGHLLYQPLHRLRLPSWLVPALCLAAAFSLLVLWFAARTARLSRRLALSEAALRALVDAAPVPMVIVHRDTRLVLYANERAAVAAGVGPDQVVGQAMPAFHADPVAERDIIDRLARDGSVTDFELPARRADGGTFWALVSARHWEFEGQPAVFAAFLDMTPQKELQASLEAALAEVRTLQRIFPICCHCKKIRDDEGLWQQIDEYFAEHANTAFSHGVCPDCLKAYYPGLAED